MRPSDLIVNQGKLAQWNFARHRAVRTKPQHTACTNGRKVEQGRYDGRGTAKGITLRGKPRWRKRNAGRRKLNLGEEERKNKKR